jgi:hypothetical protein
VIKRARRRLHIGSRPGEERLDIDAIISPLRYDVVVRQQFFEHLERHADEAHDDPETFIRASLGEPYFVWFRDVVVGSRKRFLKGRTLDEAYADQVRKAISIHEAFLANGGAAARPIVVRQVAAKAVTPTGKVIGDRRLLVDGGHRVALLRMSGVSTLEPGSWTHVVDRWPPRDNTYRLLGSLDLEPEEYYSFLSLGFTKDRHKSAETLVDAVRAEVPARLEELRSVLAVDEPLLARSRRPQ